MRCRFKSVIFLLSFFLFLGFPVQLVGTSLKMSLAQAQVERSQEQREEALRLHNEGRQLLSIGQFREALEKFQQVLVIVRKIDDRSGEGATLNNIGLVYNSLGQYQQALDYYQQALKIHLEVGDRSQEGTTLNNIGAVYRNLGQYQQALDYYQQALKISLEVGDRSQEGTTLNNIGAVYNSLGQYQQALDYYQQALKIVREIGDRSGEGTTLNNIGLVYDSLGQYPQALDYYQQALKIVQEIGDRSGEGTTLNNIGEVYRSLGQYPQALDYYQQALKIVQEIGDRSGESTTLSNIGAVYHSLGQYPQALDYSQQALKIVQEIGDRSREGTTLNNIGGVYDSLGQYPQALDYYQQALKIVQEIGDRSGEGTTLNNIGGVYDSLGQYPQALDYYQQALKIVQEIGDRSGEGTTLNNIGGVYDSLGQYPQALDYYQQALKIRLLLGDRSGEGTTLNNIGLVYHSLGQYPQALDYSQQALKIVQEIGYRSGEGTTLNNIGLVYHSLGQYPQALDYYQQALKIGLEVGERESQATNFNNIGLLLKQQNQPELAIVFYKQFVNTTESIRQDLRKLPQDLQKSYTETIADTYRSLADLLTQQDRILEAQRVLDLLKLQEIEDFNLPDIRGNEDTRSGIELLSLESEIWAGYEQILNNNNTTQLSTELTKLRRIPETERTPSQESRIKELESLEQKFVKQFVEYLESKSVKEKVATLNQKAKEQSLDLKYLEILQEKLGKLDQNGILLYPVVYDDRLELIITTLDKPPITRIVNVRPEELDQAISEFKTALTNTLEDPIIPGQKLYNWLIKPIEQDLIDANVQTIIYAPDRQLRYIPLAALHDGKQWLIERWRVNNITALSLTKLNKLPSQQLRVLAGATSLPYTVSRDYLPESYAFNGLGSVESEVNRIKSMIPSTKILLNQDFSPINTIPQMKQYNLVHFATHGKFVIGRPENSFILFGNGDIATLLDMQEWELEGVELVVLSACETAVNGLGDGVEILGLGYMIQQAGAMAAIATLWQVSDEGTQTLMSAFYELVNNKEDITTAEALRQAQIRLIESSDRNHPYYWAPFLLIGNGL